MPDGYSGYGRALARTRGTSDRFGITNTRKSKQKSKSKRKAAKASRKRNRGK